LKIRLLSVGRPRDRDAIGLHDRYAQRLERLGVDYRTAWVKETRPDGRYTDEHVREREARALLERLGRDERVVVLDRRGRGFDSERLARVLERWARPSVTLVLGGPLGLGPGVVRRAETSWSLSRLTLPHELARVVVAEQLYRAVTLLRGLPYHK